LRWLHVTRGGVNTYLTPAVKARSIQVTGSKGIHGAVFSEFALACILALAKKLPQCMDAQKRKQSQRLQPFEIEGQTIGIVGLGVAGSELARKAKALGMRVIATKRSLIDKPDCVDELGGPELLPRLLSQSDFVVLLLASVPSTFNIIGENELRMMKPSASDQSHGRSRHRRDFARARAERALDRRRRTRCLREAAAAARFRSLEPPQRDHHAAHRRHHEPKMACAVADFSR
jgi:hypothetical protein